MGNYDKVCSSDYLCNLCQKKDLVVGLGLPNIFFSVVKEPWWNGRVTTANLCVLCTLCGEEG